jgi:hypothetical protein
LAFVVGMGSQSSSHEDCGFSWFTDRTDDFILHPHAFCDLHVLEVRFPIREFDDYWG